MNRIFHSRINWYNYLYLLLLGATAFMMLWLKHAFVGVVIIIFLIILIERIINTTYVIVNKKHLTLSYGRFTRARSIPVRSIKHIERIETFKIGSFHLTSYLLVKYDGGFISMTPIKENEFVSFLLKINPTILVDKHKPE